MWETRCPVCKTIYLGHDFIPFTGGSVPIVCPNCNSIFNYITNTYELESINLDDQTKEQIHIIHERTTN